MEVKKPSPEQKDVGKHYTNQEEKKNLTPIRRK